MGLLQRSPGEKQQVFENGFEILLDYLIR